MATALNELLDLDFPLGLLCSLPWQSKHLCLALFETKIYSTSPTGPIAKRVCVLGPFGCVELFWKNGLILAFLACLIKYSLLGLQLWFLFRCCDNDDDPYAEKATIIRVTNNLRCLVALFAFADSFRCL
jgi:hypothetical protein